MISDSYKKILTDIHDTSPFGKRSKIPKHLADFIAEIKPTSILDFGCGKGKLIQRLGEEYPGIVVTGYDPGNKEFDTTMEGRHADLIISTDVLEHVEDDLKLLSKYVDKSQKDAVFVISVPAFQSLWSNHDVFLEHFRRYRKADVQKLIKNAGLIELEASYIFGSIFPLVWIIRKLKSNNEVKSDLKQSSKLVNFLILNFLKIEKLIPINKIFGTSVFVIAKKL
jgi:2-polyprenyl-3-methyl-5-hydroxy-6-metoxy-1,4-benzoquinol methylase